MSYFLSETPLKTGKVFELTDTEARHILLSRRIRAGEIVELQDPHDKRFQCRVINTDKKSLTVEPLKEIETPKESRLRITIFQALIKEQPLDFIIQKSTELGVNNIVLFNSKNGTIRYKEIDKKIIRWKKISEEAAKQSGRVKPISIEYLSDTEKIEVLADALDHLFLLEPTPKADKFIAEKTKFSTWKFNSQVTRIGILIGPEGGFTLEEVARFLKIKNITAISMGHRILRSDTAAIASSAIAQALWGDI